MISKTILKAIIQPHLIEWGTCHEQAARDYAKLFRNGITAKILQYGGHTWLEIGNWIVDEIYPDGIFDKNKYYENFEDRRIFGRIIMSYNELQRQLKSAGKNMR